MYLYLGDVKVGAIQEHPPTVAIKKRTKIYHYPLACSEFKMYGIGTKSRFFGLLLITKSRHDAPQRIWEREKK